VVWESEDLLASFSSATYSIRSSNKTSIDRLTLTNRISSHTKSLFLNSAFELSHGSGAPVQQNGRILPRPLRPLPEKMRVAYVSEPTQHTLPINTGQYSLLKRAAAEHPTPRLHLLAHRRTVTSCCHNNDNGVGVADTAVQAVRGDGLAAVRVRRHERDHQVVAQPRHEPLRARRLPPRLRRALHRALRTRPRAQDPAADDAMGLPPDLRPRTAGVSTLSLISTLLALLTCIISWVGTDHAYIITHRAGRSSIRTSTTPASSSPRRPSPAP
jgi:hypothetical protein